MTQMEPLFDGEVFVANEDNVRTMTGRGWQLLQVLSYDELQGHRDPVFQWEPTMHRNVPVDPGHAGQVVRIVRFLLGRPAASVLAELSDELAFIRERLQEAEDTAASTRKQLEALSEALSKERDDLQRQVGSLCGTRDSLITERDALRKSANELERALGKLRGALGSERISAILGDK